MQSGTNSGVMALEKLTSAQIAIAGGKGAKLGDMLHAKLPVPTGFVVTADAFRAFIEQSSGLETIRRETNGLDVHDESALANASRLIHDVIQANPMADALSQQIEKSYQAMGSDMPVAVRSSAISEDGEAASFAGQQETFLNVRGAAEVIGRVRDCWASFFTPRALFYRAQKGSLEDVEIAVVVQQMIQAEKSGVTFTVEPVQGRRDQMMIEAAFGLGEGVVSGKITPDQYIIDKDDGAILSEYVAPQRIALVYDAHGSGLQEISLPETQGDSRVLNADEIKQVSALGLQLESHFGAPQDIEWCIKDGQVYLLQSRPITTL
jgi:pyruvate,water dikinase